MYPKQFEPVLFLCLSKDPTNDTLCHNAPHKQRKCLTAITHLYTHLKVTPPYSTESIMHCRSGPILQSLYQLSISVLGRSAAAAMVPV